MQYEEKSNLEERIIAHFDGSLDSQTSKSLLNEVMESPEKRALFRAHETLNSVIAAARVPMEAPLETKRELADRIPGLIAFLPGLLGSAEAVPILQQSANPFVAFFAKMSLSTAVSIGAAVALLTTTGIIVKNNLDNNAAQPASIAAVQNQSSANTTSNTPTQMNASSQQYRMIPSQRIAMSADHSNSSARFSSNTSSNVIANTSNAQAFAANSASQSNGNSQQNLTPSENDDQTLVTNAFDAPKSAQAIAANIPVMQPQILMPMPEEVSEAITVRAYLSNGERFVQINGINGSATTKSANNIIAGLEFEIGDRYAFRIQGGQSSFAQITYTKDLSAKIVSTIQGLTAYSSTPTTLPANWATVGMSYSIPITASIPVILSADAGTVFGSQFSGIGLMGILGAAADFPISSAFTLRPQVSYDFVSASTTPASPMPAGNAILENSIKEPSMLSTAFGFQVNLMYRF